MAFFRNLFSAPTAASGSPSPAGAPRPGQGGGAAASRGRGPSLLDVDVQRAQVDRDKALDDLPRPFFDKDFDPIDRLLAEMPVPGGARPEAVEKADREHADRPATAAARPPAGRTEEERSRDVADWCYEETSRADQAMDAVQGRLSRAVMSNYSDFVEGMQLIQGVEASIERALGLAGIASRRLASGRRGMVVAGLSLVKLRRRRERLAALRLLLGRAGTLSHVEAELTRQCDANCFVAAVRTALRARADLSAHAVAGLTVLEGARERVGSGAALLAVRLRLDHALAVAMAAAPRDLDETASGLLLLPQPAGEAAPASATGAAQPGSHASEEEEAAALRAMLGGSGGSMPPTLAPRRATWTVMRLCRTLAAVSRAYASLDAAGVAAWAPEEAAAKAEALEADAVAAARSRRGGRSRAASALGPGGLADAGEESGGAGGDADADADADFELSAEGVARALDMSVAGPRAGGKPAPEKPGTAAERIQRAAQAGGDGSASGSSAPQRLVDRLPSILQESARGAVQRLTKEAVVDAWLAPKRRSAVAALLRARQLAAAEAASAAAASTPDEARAEARPRDVPEAVTSYLAARREALTGSTFAETCRRLPPQALVAATVRACGAATSALFAHSCALQWARDPVAEWMENEGETDAVTVARLFRQGLDEEDGAEEDEEKEEAAGDARAAGSDADAKPSSASAPSKKAKGKRGKPRAASRASLGTVASSGSAADGGLLERLPAEEEAALSASLASLRPALLRSRAVVWQTAQQRVGELLLEAASAGGAATRPYLGLALAVCRDFARVGTEYAGSSGGSVGWSVLRDAAAVASARAASSMLREADASLKSLLSRDAWQLVPIQRSALRGVLAAVRRRGRETVPARLRAMHATSGMGGGSGAHALSLPAGAAGASRQGGGGVAGGGSDAAPAALAVPLVRGLASAAVSRLLRRRRAARAAAMALATGAAAAVGETEDSIAAADASAITAGELDAQGFLQSRAGRVLVTWAEPSGALASAGSAAHTDAAAVAASRLPRIPTLPSSLAGGAESGNPFGPFSDGSLFDDVAVAEATAVVAEATRAAIALHSGAPATDPRGGAKGKGRAAGGRRRGTSGSAAASSELPALSDKAVLAASDAARSAMASLLSEAAASLKRMRESADQRARAEAAEQAAELAAAAGGSDGEGSVEGSEGSGGAAEHDEGAAAAARHHDAAEPGPEPAALSLLRVRAEAVQGETSSHRGRAVPLYGAGGGAASEAAADGSVDADLGRTMASTLRRATAALMPPQEEALVLRRTKSRGGAAGAGGDEEDGADDEDDEDDEEEEEEDDDEDGGAGGGDDDDEEDSDEELQPGSQAAEERADKLERERSKVEARRVRVRVARPVVTAAALNGVARAAGKFAVAMEMLPGAAPEAVRGLGRLFDLYLFGVATAFLPPAALRAVCASPDAVAAAYEAAEKDPSAAAEASAASGGGMGPGAVSAASSPMGAPKRSGRGPSFVTGGRGAAAGAAASAASGGGTVLLPVAPAAVEAAFRAAVASARVKEEEVLARRARRQGTPSLGSRAQSRRLLRSPSAVAMRSGRDRSSGSAGGSNGAAAGAGLQGAAAVLPPVVYGEPGSLSAFLATHTRLDHRKGDAGAAAVELSGRGAAGAAATGGAHGAGGSGPSAMDGIPSSRRHPFATLREELRRIAGEVYGSDWESQLKPAPKPGCGVPKRALEPSEDLVDMRTPAEAPGLACRCVAVESLGFCLEVLFAAAPRVVAALPVSHREAFQNRLVRAVTAANQLRGALYAAAAGGLGLNLRRLSERMAGARWDVLEMAEAAESAHVAEAGGVLSRAGAALASLAESGRMPERSRLAVWGALEARVWGEVVDGFAAVPHKTFAALGPIKKDLHDLQARLRRHGPAGLGMGSAGGGAGGPDSSGAMGGSGSPRVGGADSGELRREGIPAVSSRSSAFLLDWVNAMVPDGDDELLQWAREHAGSYTRRQLRALADASFNSDSRSRAATRALVDKLNKVLDEADKAE
ncbi:hypothetical protein FNF29_03139 [Cafeteria roenbergensis]|uniref:Uncharacterized protein n=5 Tax=Cafeteria roenbergensis TaxID=33653 RepID=A0A5A8CJV5_CAFRO|nr:hypothetical protein FNF29_03139 [Cafeteria roenbergensis]|eukprot:KAA0153326.1 hypothetical protein FNF29_03139 [Cafeteria roenbergensis]